MDKLRYLFIAGALLGAAAAMAVPAKRVTFTATQPDGTQLTLTRAGDEFHKYFLTADRKMVVGNATDGYYFAAVGASGRIEASKVKAADAADRDAEQRSYAASMSQLDLASAAARSREASRRAPRKGSRSLAPRANAAYPQQGIGLFPNATYPRTGSPKGLIILVEYSDVKFNTSYNAGAYFKNMLTQPGFSQYGATGSAIDWFTDASNGQFTPDFQVYGPVTLPNTQAYYGANDAAGDDEHAHEMVIDGCKLLDDQVNFKDFDTDGDGYVDNVFVFYAGQGEASYGSENTVWPHQWDLESGKAALTLDGVTISRYACTNEWEQSKPDGVGTFIHEFSHVMGLPDLYHTEDQVVYTPWDYSVLDYGPYNNDGRTPPTYSAFERNAMGWADITVLDKTPASLSLEEIQKSNAAYLIPTSKDTEFFLLENRQLTGWDAYIPGHGMLIWHVDYDASTWHDNAVNNTKSHQRVDIEEANGNPNAESLSTMAGYPFPGTSGKTSFTDTTSPNMKTWSGAPLNMPVTNIAEADGVITFDLCGGKAAIEAPVANDPSPSTEIGADFFVASWSPVDGAIDYLLTVNSLGEKVDFKDTCGFDSGKVPSGWNATTTDTYTSSGNYGAASPSLKLSKSNQAVTTPEYDNPIKSISFWVKGNTGNSSPSTSVLTIYAVDGSSETKLTEFTSFGSTAETRSYTIPNATTYRVKMAFTKNTGNIALDDIVVDTSTDGAKPLADYNAVSTGGATSVRVDKLIAGNSRYSYSVVAVNADNKKSAASNSVTVDLTAAGIGDIIADDDADSPVEYYNLQGIRVDNPASGIYIRRQGSKAAKVAL